MDRTYTFKEFLEAEVAARIGVDYAHRTDEQAAADEAKVRAQLDASPLWQDPQYTMSPDRRTWEEWVAYVKEGDEVLRRAMERGIDEDGAE